MPEIVRAVMVVVDLPVVVADPVVLLPLSLLESHPDVWPLFDNGKEAQVGQLATILSLLVP